MNQNADQNPHLYRFGHFTLDTKDTTDHRLLYHGEPLKLPAQPFLLLCTLVEHRPNPVNIAELCKALRPKTTVGTNPPDLESRLRKNQQDYIYQLIHILRERLAISGGGPEEYIETIPGEGYRFKAQAEEVKTPPIPISLYEDLKFERWIYSSPLGLKITGFLSLGFAFTFFHLLWSSIKSPVSVSLSHPAPLLLIQAVVTVGMFIGSLFLFREGGKDFHDENQAFSSVIRKRCGYDAADRWDTAKTRAKEALVQYSRCWILLLGSWAFLYPTLFLGAWRGVGYPTLIAATFFNNCNSLALILLYIVLNRPTVFKAGRDNEVTSRAGAGLVRPLKLGIGVVIFFAGGEAILALASGIAVQPDTVQRLLERADWLSGIAGAISMALYVGRGQSRFLGYSSWLYLALYFYAAIQPLYPFIRSPISGSLIMEAALMLKCVLYLHVAWLIKSGRLLFYFVRVRPIYERVNEDWKQFLLIVDEK